MIQVKDFIAVEFDLEARRIKKIDLWNFNERRKQEFKDGRVFKNLVLMGVFKTEDEADIFIKEFNDIDKLIEAVLKGEDPFA